MTRAFVLRRLHSLAGVLPLGFFLVEHLWTNATMLYGQEAFDGAVARIHRLPGLAWLELLGIFVPLGYHAIYGIFIARKAKLNVGSYPYLGNWLFAIQRVTGVLTLLFVLLHLWQFHIARVRGALEVSALYSAVERTLSTPGMFALYLAGITATIVHFANGLRTAGDTWGLARSARSRRVIAGLALALGVGMWVVGVNTLYHFVLRCGGVLPLPGLNRSVVCGS
ncbi:MAG: succinate dehydrogenase [Deltaproteobacteria bacterium]|nr:succinate dehydrogenase [Deltaproteobacteria bacterium]